jgi:hypothetical protein
VLAVPYILQVVLWAAMGAALGVRLRLLLVVFPLLAIACYFLRVRSATP